MEVFRALVEAQDGGMPAAVSRRVIAKRYGLDQDQIAEVEREGMDSDWPPLT
jgi:hypothetical protein